MNSGSWIVDRKGRKDSVFTIHDTRPTIHDPRGFTLMEMILAAALFVIVSVSSFSIFSMGLKIWKRARDISKTERRAVLALEKMGQDLRGMVRIVPKPEGQFTMNEKVSFEYKGSAKEVQIPSAYVPGEHPVMGGYGRTTYQWDSAKKGLCRSQETAADLYEEKKQDCRVLAVGVERFQLRYWLPSGLEDSYSWYDSWDPKEALPLAVEIQLELKPETQYGTKRVYKKTVVVPVGGGKYE